MFKYVALAALLVVMGEGQRPPYAGSANRYPQVLPRFQEEEAAAAAAAAAATSTASPAANVGNRVGEGSASSTISPNNVGIQGSNVPLAAGAPAQAPAGSTTTTTSELPVLALGQADFVDRIKTWPEEARPFWWTNREQINAHLHPANQQNVLRPNVETRSFFAGK